jgi:hypothetical protein
MTVREKFGETGITALSSSRSCSTIHQSGCQQWTDTGNVVKPPARFIRPVQGHDHSIEFQNLLLEAEQLSTQCGKTCTRDIRHPFVVSVGNDMEQFLDTFTWRASSVILPLPCGGCGRRARPGLRRLAVLDSIDAHLMRCALKVSTILLARG